MYIYSPLRMVLVSARLFLLAQHYVAYRQQTLGLGHKRALPPLFLAILVALELDL